MDPRACGVDAYLCSKSCLLEGGSPRMRGRPGESDAKGLRAGWIPAHAG